MARATYRQTRSHSTLWHVCRYPRPWLPAFHLPLRAARSGRCSQQTSQPAIDSQRNQGHRAVQSAHPPCHQVAMYLPSAAPIEPPTCREKSRTGSVQWLRDCHQPQDFCKFARALPPEGGVTTGKNPRSTTRNAGGRENGADSSPNHARLTPSPAKLSAFADKILKNQKKPHIRPCVKHNKNKGNELI